MGNPVVVLNHAQPLDRSSQGKTLSQKPQESHPLYKKLALSGQQCRVISYLATTAKLINESWRPSTRKQHNSIMQGRDTFCVNGQVSPLWPTLNVLAYLTHLYEKGREYNTISSAKCHCWDSSHTWGRKYS